MGNEGLFHLIRKQPGRSHLVSGWDARPLARLPGVSSGPYRDAFVRKCIELRPGESFTLAELEGPGVITRVYYRLRRVPGQKSLLFMALTAMNRL